MTDSTVFRIRPARQGDARILTDMLVEASNWNAARTRPRDVVLADPNAAHYTVGWPKSGDAGSVAVDSDGAPVGACWFRLFPADDPGYGFVATDVPELSLGVCASWRGRGVGRALLRSAIVQASDAGYARLSLSCERANFAIGLYRSEGFVSVESGADSDTMVRTLN